MQNPIRKMNMFATPESIEALCDQIERLSGSERTVAYTYAIMMMNVCAKMVDREIACQELIDPVDA
jgi:hypothetical protein